ncbi:hypothetical protein P691DRAFT_717714 [Macrolepiota fuliginosa MF-IS2]|uniref:F-box domain-containing protein n=1 Tax=Macrolepiota fuliginosa MF-IS2 TaxID=1400762 RepID=A0A9P5XPQ7_9AGAR|nr:hypothetical protein P691DRAFT_717714 [Macrolepiota fuliginosa MF-IS2]
MEVDSPVLDLNGFPEELREKIMDACDVRSMTALARTSKYWDRKRSECIYFRVVSILADFQLDPKTFLEFLTRTSSVISGSAALLVFCPGLFIPGDLDLYCSEENLDDVLDLLNTFTEYRSPEESSSKEELIKDRDYEDFSENCIAKVLKLSCCPPPESTRMDPTIVNIIAVRDVHPITAISHFHSTPVMNVITGKGAMCMYPELTLRMRGIINTHRHSMKSRKKFENCLNKYRQRGFDLGLTLGKWPGLRPDLARKNKLKSIPLCPIAFPEVPFTGDMKRTPKEVILEEDEWLLDWELSEWRF